MNWRTQLNYDPKQIKRERNTLPSMTVPDQTMSMREIMERHARGLPIPAGKIPIYNEEDDMPDPRTLDLAERQALAEQAKEEIQEIQDRFQEEKRQKTEAAKKKVYKPSKIEFTEDIDDEGPAQHEDEQTDSTPRPNGRQKAPQRKPPIS